ncbi:MAG TPA: putative Ig domain-containing protein, partial [Azospirillaceae bacterium]|nr:putative Ig domain-containing protein [Azospirillaceae bacterium]
PVIGDVVGEGNDGFTVTLSSVGGTAIGTATGTIQNDDNSLGIAATTAAQVEGQSGTTNFTFTVTRSGTTTGAASASYAVTGSGTAPAVAADFVGGALPSGTVSFAAGETTKTITIPVAGDSAGESNEGFTVTLSSPSGATLDTASAAGIIQNDDASLAISTATSSQPEGNIGTTSYTFTVTYSGGSTGSASVAYAVTGSGSRQAAAADFEGGMLPTGTLNFAAGETSKTITVNAVADTVAEANEGFAVTLSGATGAAIITDRATATIENDDDSNRAPVVSRPLADPSASAGQAFSFTVPTATFSDPDRDALSYSASLSTDASLPAWLRFDSATRKFTGTPPSSATDLAVRITATDPGELSASDYFFLRMATSTNRTPTVTRGIPDQAAVKGGTFRYVIPSTTFKDPDGGRLTLRATQSTGAALPSWMTFTAGTRTFSGKIPANATKLTIRVTATDVGGLSVSDSFIVTARASRAPTAARSISGVSAVKEAGFHPMIPSADDRRPAVMADRIDGHRLARPLATVAPTLVTPPTGLLAG